MCAQRIHVKCTESRVNFLCGSKSSQKKNMRTYVPNDYIGRRELMSWYPSACIAHVSRRASAGPHLGSGCILRAKEWLIPFFAMSTVGSPTAHLLKQSVPFIHPFSLIWRRPLCNSTVDSHERTGILLTGERYNPCSPQLSRFPCCFVYYLNRHQWLISKSKRPSSYQPCDLILFCKEF